MGIPKFFRWISERYPLCSQLIQENRIPEFDNLYLDMNGIIHPCTHGNNDDVHFRLSEEQMFLNIFHYIETLFSKIKPKKVFYMAVDGVAPRAKINQQRSRRFRTAQEAADGVAKALSRGETLPEEDAFDSNCITPGTPFMERLSRHLVYFIHKKINEDANWRNCKVIFSGQEVPGEGEHKIMEYIRLARTQPDFDPNTRHCLYGLDADLFMLGLVSHDPHFCLLREEVTFGPQKKKGRAQKGLTSPESQRFYLMHLSLFREYLDIEFAELKHSLPFAYDLERVIDDFVLMSLFVGNDFLPHLPGVHIGEGALAMMFQLYKKTLPMMSGYMNEGGVIIMDQVQMLLQELVKRERVEFEEELGMAYDAAPKRKGGRQSQQQQNGKTITTRQHEIIQQLQLFCADRYAADLHFPSDITPKDRAFITKVAKELGLPPVKVAAGGDVGAHLVVCHRAKRDSGEDEEQAAAEDDDDDASSEDDESQLARERVFRRYAQAKVVPESSDDLTAIEAEHRRMMDEQYAKWKHDYYYGKMHLNMKTPGGLDHLISSYLEGLQWVMHYYYDGVQSWGWFYPYHYAPKVSDLVENMGRIGRALPPFELGTPFRPFEQLMGVLPVRSKKLIPEAFQELMYDKSSTILDFYPLEFETDLNGKKNDWEAIVKIPFIDERRLLAAMRTREHLLTGAERRRNAFGSSFLFYYDDKNIAVNFPSPVSSFPEIHHCKTRMEPFHLPILTPGQYLKKGLHVGVKLGVDALSGFPSLHTIQHDASLLHHGVKVFNAESKNESVVLALRNPLTVPADNVYDAEQVARTVVGQRVYVGWPFLVEAVVIAMADGESYWEPTTPFGAFVTPRRPDDSTFSIKRTPLSRDQAGPVIANSNRIENQYSSRFGVLLDPIGATTIIYACLLQGMKRLDNGAIVKDFGTVQSQKMFSLATMVTSVRDVDMRFDEKPAPPIDQEFPVGTRGFYLGDKVYGCPLEITGHTQSGRGLIINVWHSPGTTEQPMFGKVTAKQGQERERYMPGFAVAKQLGVSGMTVSKLTASVYITPRDRNGQLAPGEKMNIALGLKFEARKQKVVGYTRRTDQYGWEYSQRAVDLLRDYKSRFPSVFAAVEKGVRDPMDVDLVFPSTSSADSMAQLGSLKQWLKEKGIKDLERVALEVESMGKDQIAALEAQVDLYVAGEGNPAFVQPLPLQGIPAHMILTPEQAPYRLSKEQAFHLGDRVVFVPNVGSIPSGARGTIVGVEKPTMTAIQRDQDQTVQQKNHVWISVVFDQPFLGGTNLNGMCSERRGQTVSSETLLNLSSAQPPIHRKYVSPDWMQSQLNSITAPLPPTMAGKLRGDGRQQQQQHGQGSSASLSGSSSATSSTPRLLVRPASAAQQQPAQPYVKNTNVWDGRKTKQELLTALQRPGSGGAPNGQTQQRQPNAKKQPLQQQGKDGRAKSATTIQAKSAPATKAVPPSADDLTHQLKAMLNLSASSNTSASPPSTGLSSNVDAAASKQLLQMLQQTQPSAMVPVVSSVPAVAATKPFQLPPTSKLGGVPTSVLRGRRHRGRGGNGATTAAPPTQQ